MISLSLQGVRGGLGCTSLLAGLGYALHQLGERVLLVDLCPENLLRLHFNVPWTGMEGWARAEIDGVPWQTAAWQIADTLWLLPYGVLEASEQKRVEQQLLQEPNSWAKRSAVLQEHFDWLLFDLPRGPAGHAACLRPDCLIHVVEADAACQVLLQQYSDEPQSKVPLLVNHFDPCSQLQRDLWLFWQQKYAGLLLLPIHADAAMAEALACKSPIGHYAPASLAAKDMVSLAIWCLAQKVPS